jgi:diguanylate cyclase (GGDEF)-like protein
MDRPSFKDVKGMLICGILSSENVDSSGEVVSLEGMDISSLEAGEGVANYEHLGAAEGQGKEVVGRIVYVKKIYKESDCDDEDEKFLFKETRKKPYLFGIIRLADGAGHHEAQDLAAHIRDHVAHNEDVLLRYSIEGSTVEKEGNYIKTSIARKVAMTFGPANKAVKNKIIADPNAPDGFEKFAIAKSEVMQDPTCRAIGSAVELKYNPLVGAYRELQKGINSTHSQRLSGGEWGEYSDNDTANTLFPDAFSNKEEFANAVEKAPLEHKTDWNNIHEHGGDKDLYGVKGNLPQVKERVWGYHKDRWMPKAGDNEPVAREMYNKYFDALVGGVRAGKTPPTIVGVHKSPSGVVREHVIGGNTRALIHSALGMPTPVKHVPLKGRMRTFDEGGNISDTSPIEKSDAEIEARLIKNITILKTLRKAMDAGCGEGAPSTLTQGAALQKEDLGNVVKNNVLGAIRDYGDEPWDRQKFKNHLKKYLAKAQLPEVSDSCIDHKHPRQTTPATAVLNSPNESVIEEDRTDIPEAVPTHLTFRGKKLRPNPKVKKIVLDTKKGVLHTPHGSFKLHNPATEAPEVAQHFQDLLNSPHTHKIMSQALAGWHQVHQLNKAGELPEEIPMTATILSTCSGNRPVPLTELQTVRIVDAMKNSGIDIRKPGFEHIMPHLRALDKPDVLPMTGGEAIGKDPAYFLGNKIGVERDLFGNKVGEPSGSAGPSGKGPKVVTEDSRYPGELKSINPLMSDTIKHLSQYHKVHNGLVDLVKRHKTDMSSGIKELMGMKQARTNWNNRRRAIVASGKEDPGEYKGMNIPGIKLKTGLYAYGMLGGGSSVVPDTHFIRHMFGLDTHKDAKTLLYLKKALWNPSNYHIIENYNNWYRKNHPAHKWMVNHPDFKHMFEKPEDATFPAFWGNWMNIAPYEQKLGTSYSKQAHNMGSTHAPYWAAIEPYVNQAMKRLGKSEDFDTTFPLRAALIMQHYVRDYGEIPAQMLYYQHLVPKLLECAKNRQDASDAIDFLKKALRLEEGLIELRKDIRHVVEGGHSVELPEVYKVSTYENGKEYPAGRFMTSKGKLHHLEDGLGLLDSMLPEGPVTAKTISRIHGLMASPHFGVQGHALPKEEPGIDGQVANVPQVSVVKQPAPNRASVFSYFRPGMSHPHIVEFTPNGAALDGKALSHDELGLMLENSRKGLAQIKWNSGGSLQKREATEDLMSLDDATRHIRAAEEAGHLPKGTAAAHTKHIYEDSMVPGIGNKYAAQRFREQNRPGVFASLDANDFKHINDVHGHDAGDEAIKSFGSALREASAKVGTTKAFRSGGDEFSVWSPTHEDMARFMGHARAHVEALPLVGGVHKQSFSAGLGHNFAVADRALGIAKQGKLDPVTKQRLHAPGQVPNLAHSLVPGHEGPLMQPETIPPKMAVG